MTDEQPEPVSEFEYLDRQIGSALTELARIRMDIRCMQNRLHTIAQEKVGRCMHCGQNLRAEHVGKLL